MSRLEDSDCVADVMSKESFWGCTLTLEKNFVWKVTEEEEDEGDRDLLRHKLFLKSACMTSRGAVGLEQAGGGGNQDGEHVVTVASKDAKGQEITVPIVCLQSGHVTTVPLDLTFPDKYPVTFTLICGCHAVHLSGLVSEEFPRELVNGDSEDESAADDMEESLQEANDSLKVKAKKGRSQRGKVKSTEEEEEDDDDEDEDDEDEEEEEEDESQEESPKTKAKAKKISKPKVMPAKRTAAKTLAGKKTRK